LTCPYVYINKTGGGKLSPYARKSSIEVGRPRPTPEDRQRVGWGLLTPTEFRVKEEIMKKKRSIIFLVVISAIFFLIFPYSNGQNEISLPNPTLKGQKSFEELLSTRRSRRSFKEGAITLKELSQILWASQGITSQDGKRTAPSAGALYPLEIYVVAGKVEGLEPGIYHYDASNHKLIKVIDKDRRSELNLATGGGRKNIENAPVSIVITAIYERTTKNMVKEE
jgi:hypothetical protein